MSNWRSQIDYDSSLLCYVNDYVPIKKIQTNNYVYAIVISTAIEWQHKVKFVQTREKIDQIHKNCGW